MTDRRRDIYLEKGLRIATVGAFFYMIYLILVCWAPVRESHELIAVQWCRNDDSGVHYVDNISRHGLYVYLKRSSREIIVREMNSAIDRPFQPYRYIYTTIGHGNDVNLVREEWGLIKCLKGNKAIIGTSDYVFSWGHDR